MVEGDKDTCGLLANLVQIRDAVSVPVIVKETGCGIAAEQYELLLEEGFAAFDCAGAGGTNFPAIEAKRQGVELTEEFAKSIGYDSLAAMRESIRAQKQKIHEEGADRAAGQRLLEMAGANIEVHIAPETLDRTADNEMKLLGERLSRSGLTVEQHCKNSHTTPEALRQRYRDEAESRVRVMLAARAIAEAEQIVVHPEEVNAEYRRLAALQETPEAEIRKVLTEDAVAAALAAKKVQRFLLDHAEVTSVTDSAEKE